MVDPGEKKRELNEGRISWIIEKHDKQLKQKEAVADEHFSIFEENPQRLQADARTLVNQVSCVRSSWEFGMANQEAKKASSCSR